MSTLVLSGSPGDARPRRPHRFFRPFGELLDGIRLARAMAHRYEILSHKSDATLAAAGVKRQDIPNLVVNGKYDL